MYRFFPGDTANFDHDRSQRRRKKNTDHIFKLLVMICIKCTQDPGVKLFCIKRRLQIQESLQRLLFQLFADLGTGGKDQRSCHSEMSKHHLAEIFIENFFAGFYCKLHIPKGKALKFGDIIFFCHQWYQ